MARTDRSIARALPGLLVLLLLPLGMAWAATNSDVARLDLHVGGGALIDSGQPLKTVLLAEPGIAQAQVVSAHRVFVFGLRRGRTTLFGIDRNGRVALRRDLQVLHDLATLRAAVAALAPAAEVELVSTPRRLIVRGSAPSPVMAREIVALAKGYLGEGEQVVDQLRIEGSTQVNIRVRVAEVSHTVEEALGLDWRAIFSSGGFLLSFLSGGFAAAPTAQAGGLHPSTLLLSQRAGPLDVTALADALAEEDLVTVLAEPNLTALSGETASFLAGGEFPVPVAADEDRVTIEFKSFGVLLQLTPTVLDGNRISLRIRPEVSTLAPDAGIVSAGLVIPGISVRRAETTIELASGQSFAIAGLFRDESRNGAGRVPGLGTLPVLGNLFRSKRFRQQRSELVIFVSAYLVRPVSARALADPLQDLPRHRRRGGGFEKRPAGAPLTGGIGVPAATLRGGAGFVY